MKRKRVGGVDDDQLPEEVPEEVEMEIQVPRYHVAVETVGGQRVVVISSVADVMAVLHHEGDYADLIYFAVRRLCLNEASSMVRRLVQMKTTRQAMKISNAPALLQASALRSAIIQLSKDLSHLHEGLRTNSIIWELVDHIRAMPALPLNHQPAILRHGIENLVADVRATLAVFPAEPAGRHAGPNTIPATSHATDLCTTLSERVGAHLEAVDSLLASSVDYPNMMPASFVALDVEQLDDKVYSRIRGLDHLRLLLSLPKQGLLTEFCVSQLYVGDAHVMLEDLTTAMELPYGYSFANIDRVKGAREIRNILISISHSLQNIAHGLEAGQIDRDNLESLEDLVSKFLKPVLGQCRTGAFRDAALALHAGLLEMLDHPDLSAYVAACTEAVDLLGQNDDGEQPDLSADVAASTGAADAGEGDAAPAGLVAVLTPLVERLLEQVGALWGIGIEYADESLPEEVLQAQAGLDD